MISRIVSLLFSMRLMAVLLLVFAISIATATFIENDFGTNAAKDIIYNALWFEIILGLLFVNLTGNIFIRKLYQKGKFTIFLFHIAFNFILIGAFFTRYIGEEGYMHIRENEYSDFFLSSETYLQIDAKQGDKNYSYSTPVLFSSLSSNSNLKKIDVFDQNIKIKSIDYVPNAKYALIPSKNGVSVIEIITSDDKGRKSIFIKDGDSNKIGTYSVSFNDTSKDADIKIFAGNNKLQFKSVYDIQIIDKNNWSENRLKKSEYHPFKIKSLYKIEGISFVLKGYLQKGDIGIVPADKQTGESLLDALVLEISSKNKKRNLILWGKQNTVGRKENFEFEDIDFIASYGSKVKKIPFAIQLTDFQLERYPGSNSPSSFESKVILTDNEKNITEPRNIFMNNVLKHRGYRFYQTSYDADEKGTVLSVNKDLFGTLFTYFGYTLMGIGMFLSLFNKNSRFMKLRNTATIALIFIFISNHVSATGIEDDWKKELPNNTVHKHHANQFGELLIQDNGGRIKPVNTLSSQILRKIARKTTFEGLTSDQVFLGMLSNPEYWQKVPLIKVSHEEIRSLLGLKSKYTSFYDIIYSDTDDTYRLAPYVERAYMKTPAYRTKFDNEIIRLDERINICLVVFQTNLLKIFPVPNDYKNNWYAPTDSLNVFTDMDSLFTNSIISIYFQEINNALKSNDWSKPDEYLNYIKLFQEKYGGHIMPSDRKQVLEIWYNKANLFNRLASIYGLIGFILLIFHFIGILIQRYSFKIIYAFGDYILLLLFAAHTFGLILRWYISGHAPWSNGYEALTYIGWATILAGIIFSKKARITLPVTAVLAFLILHVAHLSWMDPEITNLVPVLKSIWLVIHVAIITASYGFLALGALLALVNLILMNFQTSQNVYTINTQINRLTAVIEMTLIIGLYMLTIGTFLGGVWANESWGRYWGWDPKEAWALITVLIYAFIAHMRIIPGLKGIFIFNLIALFGFSSVIMTYFGVNYYLSGLHSYAKGDPVPIPDYVFYTITVLSVISILAYINKKRTDKLLINNTGDNI